jgi:hypothetical protein
MTMENSYQLKHHLDFYGELGLNVIPILAPTGKNDPKRPALSEWTTYQKRKSTSLEHKLWWEYSDEPRNIGIVTGRISGGLIVVDIDDEDTYMEIKESDSRISDTLVAKTGKGYHCYFFMTEQEAYRTITFRKNGKVHHLKGENSYVVAPPSTHASGKIYSFLEETMPAFISMDNLKGLLSSAGCQFTVDEQSRKERPSNWASELVATVFAGERNTRAAQLCGLLINKFSYDPDFIKGMLFAWNNTFVKPKLTDEELSTIFNGEWRRYGPNGN